MNNISFGQYYPANSFLHRMDARMKLALTVLYIVCVFLCQNLLCFALLALSAIFLVLLSKVPAKIVFRSLRPIIFIMVFTAVLNLFWTKGAGDPLFHWWKLSIYPEGIYQAVFMVVRIVVLLLGTSLLLTYTTTPIALTDAIESVLSPLRVFHLHVHEFAMMMTIALRFIPTLSEEASKIMNAQKARGVDFSHGGLIRRAKSLVPILIPLFVSSFRRADELAMAMECRCYRGGKGRTRMTVPHLHARDIAALIVMIGFGAGIVLLRIYGSAFLEPFGLGYTM